MEVLDSKAKMPFVLLFLNYSLTNFSEVPQKRPEFYRKERISSRAAMRRPVSAGERQGPGLPWVCFFFGLRIWGRQRPAAAPL